MARWAAKEPAWPRVVPREEKKMDGGGARVESLVDQVDVSEEVRGCNFGEGVASLGSRRERAWMLEMVGRVRRVERMCEPCNCTVRAMKGCDATPIE